MNCTRIYNVIDLRGVVHTVFARSAVDATSVWHHALNLEPVALPSDVHELTREQAEALPFRDDDGTVIGTVWAEYEREPIRGYLGADEDMS